MRVFFRMKVFVNFKSIVRNVIILRVFVMICIHPSIKFIKHSIFIVITGIYSLILFQSASLLILNLRVMIIVNFNCEVTSLKSL